MQTIESPAASAYKSQEDRRFGELAARTGLEPALAARYADDPSSVLAEFGLPVAEPLYWSELGADAELILIEDLDRPVRGTASNCIGSWTGALVRE